MGIIDRLQKAISAPMDVDENKAHKTEAAGVSAEEAQGARAFKDKTANTAAASSVPEHLRALLQRPHVSEKAAGLAVHNVYVFKVALTAEKVAIKRAVEGLYGVKVVAVRTVRGLGKPTRRGRRLSARSDWKKALVTLAPGQKIDVYAGV